MKPRASCPPCAAERPVASSRTRIRAMPRHQPHLSGAATAFALCVLAGCSSLQPQPATTDQIRDRVVTDQLAMYNAQEPVKGPITFYQAAARALKYNLDYRLKLMESALA